VDRDWKELGNVDLRLFVYRESMTLEMLKDGMCRKVQEDDHRKLKPHSGSGIREKAQR
jgi:hypothetical protein